MSQSKNFPVEIRELGEKEKNLAKKLYLEHVVQVGSKKWFTKAAYAKHGPELYNFQVKPDDVWLLGFNGSGIGLTEEIIWLMKNNLNTEKAKQVPTWQRFPLLEHVVYYNPEEKDPQRSAQVAKVHQELKTKEKRLIKSRLPFSLLPKNLPDSGCKIIYVIRDPRDVVVSNYEVYEKFSKIKPFVDFPYFWKLFKENLVLWGPFFEHIKEAWSVKDKESVLIIFYNDLLNNQKNTIKRIGKFLGTNLSKDNIEIITEYCKTEFIKSPIDARGDQFIKEDQKWKRFFVNGLEKEVDDWIKENIKNTDIKFTSS